jgi:hypothetical protein
MAGEAMTTMTLTLRQASSNKHQVLGQHCCLLLAAEGVLLQHSTR